MQKLLHQAHIELKPGSKNGSDKVTLERGGTIEWLNIHSDKPGVKMDIKVTDQFGNTVVERKGMTSETNRLGERLSLPISDSYYTIEVDNVEGANVIDAFLE